MGADCKRFVVLGMARTGSGSFLDALHKVPGLVTPAIDTEVRLPELLNPRTISDFMSIYSTRIGMELLTESDLINAFYSLNSDSAFSGFKAFYHQVHDFQSLTTQQDLKIIVLLRQDIASTLASYIVALDRGCWGRQGESHKNAWRFHQRRRHQLKEIAELYHTAMSALLDIRGAIVVRFEDLCSENFSDERLNSFFGQNIAFLNPKPPVCGSSYVVNWTEFKGAVDEFWPGELM